MSEVDGENARLKSLLKQKDDEMEDIDKVTKRLQEERGKVADIIRQEFADRLVLALYLLKMPDKARCQQMGIECTCLKFVFIGLTG